MSFRSQPGTANERHDQRTDSSYHNNVIIDIASYCIRWRSAALNFSAGQTDTRNIMSLVITTSGLPFHQALCPREYLNDIYDNCWLLHKKQMSWVRVTGLSIRTEMPRDFQVTQRASSEIRRTIVSTDNLSLTFIDYCI